jgi:recombination protein RecA
MAKEKKEAPSALDAIFSQLVGQHNKVSPGSATLGAQMESEIKYWVDSGSTLLNMILSNRPDGGWPCGRIVEVFGRESIGKSTLGYVAMANAQKAGGIALYADIERTGNKKFMELLGVDLKSLIYTDIPEIEKLFEALQYNLITIAESKAFTNKPVMIVIDSVTALQTTSEMESGYEFNMNVSMGKAKQLGKALKKIIPYLAKANACLYFVNQVRDNTSGYGESYVVPGGKAIPFYSSVRLYLEGKTKIVAKDPTLENEYQIAIANWKALGGNKSGIEKPEKPKSTKENETTVGYEVTAYTKKNKTAPPDRRTPFRIVFSQGLFDEECWLDQCIKYGIVKASGAYNEIVAFPNDLGKFYKTGWMEVLQSSKELYDKIKNLLIDKMTVKLQLAEYAIEDEAVEETDNANDYSVAEELD